MIKNSNYLRSLVLRRREKELKIDSIIFLFAYFILSGICSIYKIFTIIVYFPKTKTLFDSILDVCFFIYLSIYEDSDEKKINIHSFWINAVLQLIISFFILVYNEFLIL